MSYGITLFLVCIILLKISGGKNKLVSPYLDFSLHKCNWVDTRQDDLGDASISNGPLPTASDAYETV